MQSRPRAVPADERGQANLFLLIGLTLSLLALTMLFVRLGDANQWRGRSQTAADAAALAAVTVARDNAAEMLAGNQIPAARLYEPARGRTSAERYARRNGAVLENIRASDNALGQLGNFVRVETRGAECRQELLEDGSRAWSDLFCPPEEERDPDADEGLGSMGNASAIAEMVMPDCSYVFGVEYRVVGVECDGQVIQSEQHARRLITIRLTGEEGQYIYKPFGAAEEFQPEPTASPSP
ncbi:pilus assembly protein TadG-related protein [Nocardiopsis ansamitocini]|uniref:Uncharacterized protein n=1 Tax=Nocardiopsis ansamitocini TaxID=1670832 RepID=A0A9W6P5V7_9ACTN|nr:pilus assembly protein TadG-related protein [Nocardiopsis ansamitocini]GLU47760.1 hypothetical protein Nans01_21110 [Nocardiopsis ansamitocini]